MMKFVCAFALLIAAVNAVPSGYSGSGALLGSQSLLLGSHGLGIPGALSDVRNVRLSGLNIDARSNQLDDQTVNTLLSHGLAIHDPRPVAAVTWPQASAHGINPGLAGIIQPANVGVIHSVGAIGGYGAIH